MKLVTFRQAGIHRVGSVFGDRVVDLHEACAAMFREQGKVRYRQLAEAYVPADMIGLLEGGAESLEAAERAAEFALARPETDDGRRLVYRLGEVRLEAPIPKPEKIICVGHNYREHILEMKREIPQYPVIFAKFPNTVRGPEDDIPFPAATAELDYEAEFAFVIGKKATGVRREDALAYVAGYTIANDVSCRDLQRRTIQWLQGKTVDGTLPTGPWLVTADEIPDPSGLGIELRVNGELRQKSNTANLVFDVPYLVEFLSGLMTLQPGDLVCTGTPGGVGAAMNPPVFLKPGDVVRIDIERIGTLENRVTSASGEGGDRT